MAVSSSRVQQSKRWMLLPEGWDDGWKKARAVAGTTPAYVTVIGDSNAQGFSSTDHMTKSYPRLLRAQLVAKYGSHSDYFSIAQSARYQTLVSGAAPAGTPPWTFDTTWGQLLPQMSGGFGYTMLQDNVVPAGQTYPPAWVNAGSGAFVTPTACTALDIIYHDFNVAASTWKYSVDNAAGTGLVTMTNDGRNSPRRQPVTGLANTTHTIRFGAASAQQIGGINGILTYDPTNAGARGIGFANVSGSGIQVADWQSTLIGMPDDRIRTIQGRYKTSTTTTLETGFGFPTQPHLAIVELGINDCAGSRGLIYFRTGLRRMIDAIRRGRDNASILFLICPNASAATTDQTSQFARAESWSLYADQMYGVAAEYQCAVFNVHSDWVPTSVAQGFTTAGDPHPTDAGHQAIADALASVIL